MQVFIPNQKVYVTQRKQLKLGLGKQKLEFGGSKFRTYNPNAARPIAAKTPIHVVMRSPMAKGHLSLLFFDKEISKILNKHSKKLGIRIYDLANAGNHLHFICYLPRQSSSKVFIRSGTGLIARLALGAERGRGLGAKFWEGRPWTRILMWGKAYSAAKNYLGLNKIEALGFSRSTARILMQMNC